MVFFLQGSKCGKAIVGSMGWNFQLFIDLPSNEINACICGTYTSTGGSQTLNTKNLAVVRRNHSEYKG